MTSSVVAAAAARHTSRAHSRYVSSRARTPSTVAKHNIKENDNLYAMADA